MEEGKFNCAPSSRVTYVWENAASKCGLVCWSSLVDVVVAVVVTGVEGAPGY